MSYQRVRILVTTSHRPTQRVRSFIKDLASVLPYALKINRGKSTMTDLYYDAMGYGAERVIVVTVWKGNPGRIRVYKPCEPPDVCLEELATITLKGVKLRREVPGSKKLMGSRSLGIDVTSVGSEQYKMLADTLARAFLARLVLNEEDYTKYDVILRMHREGELVRIEFISPKDMRVCGPVLRVVSVVDHVSGFRMHRASTVTT